MRIALCTASILLLSTAAWVQTGPAQGNPPAAPMHGCMRMMQPAMPAANSPMTGMKAQVEKMRATLEQMKANLAKMKQPEAVRQQDQFNIDLWEAMVSHMESMVNAMSQGPATSANAVEPGCCAGMRNAGGGMQGGGCCGGMNPGHPGCMKPNATPAPKPSAPGN
jgi:TolA-binding protein